MRSTLQIQEQERRLRNLHGMQLIGFYYAHGFEIVQLHFNEQTHELQAIKVTGDDNVPAGQITFTVSMRASSSTQQQQEEEEEHSPEQVSQSNSARATDVQTSNSQQQQPEEVGDDGSGALPIFGRVQVADFGHNNPRFLPLRLFYMEDDASLFIVRFMESGILIFFRREDTIGEHTVDKEEMCEAERAHYADLLRNVPTRAAGTLSLQSAMNEWYGENGPRGLSQEQVEAAIRTRQFVCQQQGERNRAAVAGNATSCSICLQCFGDGDTLGCVDRCGHEFHRDCISRWLVRCAVCPLCRTEL